MSDWRLEVCKRDVEDAERMLAAFDGNSLPKIEWYPSGDRDPLNDKLTLSYLANLLLMKVAPLAAQREQILLRDWDLLCGKIPLALKRRIADRQSYMDQAA